MSHLVEDTGEKIQGQTLYGVGEQLNRKKRGETLVGLPENGRVPSAIDEQRNGVIEKFYRHGTVRVRSICKKKKEKNVFEIFNKLRSVFPIHYKSFVIAFTILSYYYHIDRPLFINSVSG